VFPNLAHDLLEPSSVQKNERIVEINNLLSSDFGKRIICKAASTNSAFSIEDIDVINKITRERYLHILENIGIIKTILDGDIKKFEITPEGREFAKTLHC
jgi:hypothetical protein